MSAWETITPPEMRSRNTANGLLLEIVRMEPSVFSIRNDTAGAPTPHSRACPYPPACEESRIKRPGKTSSTINGTESNTIAMVAFCTPRLGSLPPLTRVYDLMTVLRVASLKPRYPVQNDVLRAASAKSSLPKDTSGLELCSSNSMRKP